jgi:membrane protein DedA with SNARE-associated domain
MDTVIHFFDALPPAVVYIILGLGAALENLFPPVPADTFVLLGGFLASAGAGDPLWVFLSTWGANVGGALIVYGLGHVHGRPFFEQGWGRRLINPRQLEALGRFYARWGTLAIFFTRFLPGFRAVVPVFAGVTHHRFAEVAPAIAIASGIWYGALVWVGAVTEQNLDTILAWLSGANRVFLALAVALAVIVGIAWYRTRHHDHAAEEEG